jgi:hypothetical protein
MMLALYVTVVAMMPHEGRQGYGQLVTRNASKAPLTDVSCDELTAVQRNWKRFFSGTTMPVRGSRLVGPRSVAWMRRGKR